MVGKLIKIGVLLLFTFTSLLGYAQESVLSSGGQAIGSGGKASYSVGQVVSSTFFGSTGSIAQGVQQAYEIYVVSATNDANFIALQCVVYPNPVTDFLVLNTKRSEYEGLSFLLLDMNGKVLQKNIISEEETRIYMGELVRGTYFVKVAQGNTALKTFKIIKK